MWANAQRDGRPAEYTVGGALCSTPQSLADAHVLQCSAIQYNTMQYNTTYTTINFTRLSVVSLTVGVVDRRLAAATLSGTGSRVYTAHRGWLGVVTGISAASTGGVRVQYNNIKTNAGSVTECKRKCCFQLR